MIGFLVLAAVAVVAAMAIHHRQCRRGAAVQYVLASVPAALLFIILPTPLLMLKTVRGFKHISDGGGSSYARTAQLCMDIDRTLWLGSLGVLLTMVVAALLQRRASVERAEGTAAPHPTWIEWIPIACALSLLPTGLLVYIVGDVPRLLISALEIMSGPSGARLTSSDLATLSQEVAARLVVGTVIGLALGVVVLAAAAVTVVATGHIRQPRQPARYAWAILAVVVAWATWNAVRLHVEIRRIERVSSAGPAHTASLPEQSSGPSDILQMNDQSGTGGV